MRTKHLCVLIHIRNKGELATVKMFKLSSNVLTDRSRQCLLCGSFLLSVFRVCFYHTVLCSVQPCGHLLGKDLPLGSLVCVVFLCVFVTFSYGILGQVWYLIVSIPAFCFFLT